MRCTGHPTPHFLTHILTSAQVPFMKLCLRWSLRPRSILPDISGIVNGVIVCFDDEDGEGSDGIAFVTGVGGSVIVAAAAAADREDEEAA